MASFAFAAPVLPGKDERTITKLLGSRMQEYEQPCARPLKPGATDAGRKFMKETFVQRRNELTVSRRALGQVGEVVVLNSTPQGDFICVYLEGEDPVEAKRRSAASTRPYDVWFKQQLATLFPSEINFSKPIPR